jgi:hypothetical protein
MIELKYITMANRSLSALYIFLNSVDKIIFQDHVIRMDNMQMDIKSSFRIASIDCPTGKINEFVRSTDCQQTTPMYST